MKYIKENKKLLLKYLLIVVSNIVLCILCSFYFKTSTYKNIIMLLLVIVLDMVIYYYKEKEKFNLYLDIVCNIIVGLILLIFERNMLSYSNILVSLFLANNIVFTRSRLSNKFFMKTLQYMMILINTIICMFINLLIFCSIFS